MIRYTRAHFQRRLNRFVACVQMLDEGEEVKVHVPNTGRLAELLIPGREVFLSPSGGKYPFSLKGVLYRGNPVFIDAVASNGLFADFLKSGAVPGMEDYRLIRREPALGNHRFDFLLEEASSGRELLAEIKSCTLCHRGVSAFPDAPTLRGTEHVRLLAGTGRGLLIFLLMHGDADLFVPNFHTDFPFYSTLNEARERLDIRALRTLYRGDGRPYALEPVPIHFPEVEPTGCYLLLLENDENRILNVGALGEIFFKAGYYSYAGSGRGNLFARIRHHRTVSRRPHWHMDYIKSAMRIRADLPIVTEEEIECRLAEGMTGLGGEAVSGFWASDCRCSTHLHYFREDPRSRTEFWDLILEHRFGRFRGTYTA